jgi:hypothetical protein
MKNPHLNARRNPPGRPQPKPYARAQKWVQVRLKTKSRAEIKDWIHGQYRQAADAMRAARAMPRTQDAQHLREGACVTREWLKHVERALLAPAPKRKAKPFWRRTKLGVWGCEVQTATAARHLIPDSTDP